MENDERMRDLSPKSGRSAEFFLGDDYPTACEIAEDISHTASDEHEENCPNDEECRGVTPYILKGLKEYFLNHPELTELVRLAITAELFHFIGANSIMGKMQAIKEDMEEGEGHIRDILDSIPGSSEDTEEEPDDNDKN
jgi:hypothetical protein